MIRATVRRRMLTSHALKKLKNCELAPFEVSDIQNDQQCNAPMSVQARNSSERFAVNARKQIRRKQEAIAKARHTYLE